MKNVAFINMVRSYLPESAEYTDEDVELLISRWKLTTYFESDHSVRAILDQEVKENVGEYSEGVLMRTADTLCLLMVLGRVKFSEMLRLVSHEKKIKCEVRPEEDLSNRYAISAENSGNIADEEVQIDADELESYISEFLLGHGITSMYLCQRIIKAMPKVSVYTVGMVKTSILSFMKQSVLSVLNKNEIPNRIFRVIDIYLDSHGMSVDGKREYTIKSLLDSIPIICVTDAQLLAQVLNTLGFHLSTTGSCCYNDIKTLLV